MRQLRENTFNGPQSSVFCFLCVAATLAVWLVAWGDDPSVALFTPRPMKALEPLHVTYALAVYAGYLVLYKLVWCGHAYAESRAPVQLYATCALGMLAWPAAIMHLRTILEK